MTDLRFYAKEMDREVQEPAHGPNAEGRGQFPRLAGQLYPYTIKALSNWSSERGQIPGKPDVSVVMAPVAHSLSRQEIEAVAAYVGTLK